jgi:alpha-glucosidase
MTQINVLRSQTHRVASPDNSVVVQITEGESLSYTVSFNGKTIIEPSRLAGFEFKNEPALGNKLKVINVVSRSNEQKWRPVVKSKHAEVLDKYNELTLSLQEQEKDKRLIDLVFRVYDDGVAFRSKLHRSSYIGNRQITKELTSFNIPGNPDAWVVEY